MPKLSVIIPLYNKGFIITKTLASVFAQTFTDFEIIIIDDGSTDNSVEKVKQFNDTRIQLFQQKNQGAATARNLGIEKANCELIAFLDADDYWFPNHLAILIELQEKYINCGIYASRYLTKIASNKTITNSFKNSISDDFEGIIPDFFEASLINRVATSSSILVPKTILLQNNGFNKEVTSGQDLELWTKIGITHTVAISNQITAIYNFELPNSLSKTSFAKKKLMDFKQFSEAEKQNLSLKNFLDIYRLEYALQFRIAGDLEKSNFYLKDITSEIPFKTKVLLFMPSFILRFLLKTKHLLKKYGVEFSVYH
ncbi:glycosyltransferase family 2 protein [Flavobacterium proteolyticum]|uniref:Glycosyltransferase family 2 protein n=1 Tax=Flavobacterium proteolyticum TaxID=2911683 RepID=A0ABR9WRR0_9FLAO|nr:glycosyltransferase family A protein [Flavobacterium proteolyticum]MBE9576179.1 glycosyltransferase family 2 protein [Flavobacterium proteolyticum]